MPAAYEHLVKKLKKNPEVDNPYALAHHIQNKKGSDVIHSQGVKPFKFKIPKTRQTTIPVHAASELDLILSKARVMIAISKAKNQIKQHKMQSEHGQLKFSKKFDESEHPRDEDGEFKCKKCGKGFSTEKDKNTHESGHEPDDEADVFRELSDKHSHSPEEKKFFSDTAKNIESENRMQKVVKSLLDNTSIPDRVYPNPEKLSILTSDGQFAVLHDNNDVEHADLSSDTLKQLGIKQKNKYDTFNEFMTKTKSLRVVTYSENETGFEIRDKPTSSQLSTIKSLADEGKSITYDIFYGNKHLNGDGYENLIKDLRERKLLSGSLGMKFEIPQFRYASLESQTDQHATYFLLAGDEVNGRGWGVTEESIPVNIETFVDEPFVITTSEYIKNSPYGKTYDHPSTEHFDILGIAPLGSFNVNDVGLIKNFQQQFAIGDIRKVYFKEGIWRADITKRQQYAHVPWPPFCSPAIYKLDPHEPDGRISRWFGLHLAGLDQRPAYGNIAIFKAACSGHYEGKCEAQLRAASLPRIYKMTPCRVGALLAKIKQSTQQIAALDSGDISDTQIVNLLQMTQNPKKKKKYKNFSEILRESI